jgi:hypothetical protein
MHNETHRIDHPLLFYAANNALQERCMDKSLQLALARAELDHLNLLHNQLPYKEMLVQAMSLLGADKGKGLDLTDEQVFFNSLNMVLLITLHCTGR